MEVKLPRPEGLPDRAWDSITASRERLQRAERDGDWSQMIGSAKELVEATARVVVEARGDPVPSDMELTKTLNQAHSALGRQPGQGLATDPPIRDIAAQAKKIASQLPELRNRYGTGHGRAALPQIDEEAVLVSIDAAMLWCRWALRRLEHLISGQPAALAQDLQSFARFYKGTLARRLEDAGLPDLSSVDQHLLGLAVGRRAMEYTGVVREDGVEACAENSDLSAWPAAYREGLAEGLFLNHGGYVNVDDWAVRQATSVLAVHPQAADVLAELEEKIKQAGWAYQLIDQPDRRSAVISHMRASIALLPDQAQGVWTRIVDRFTALGSTL